MLYDPKHYTLDLIPEHRQRAIDNKISYLIDKYDITYPLDSVKLMNKILSQDKPIVKAHPVYLGTATKFEAEARYYPAYDAYILFYNVEKMRYPYITSSERRFNFTLPHEVGHIELGHLKVLNPTPEQKALFEIEADEFSGRFLMPEDDILTSAALLKSPERVSAQFLVSEQCLWRRLNNLKMLEVLYRDKGYVYDYDSAEELFSLFDTYEPEKSFEEIAVTSQNLNFKEFLKMLTCPSCGNNMNLDALFCSRCGHILRTAFL